MFSATLAENRKGSSLTTATAWRSERQVDVAHVGAVEQHAAAARVVQPRDQRDEAGLARAGGADERDVGAGRHVEVDVAEHGARGARRDADAVAVDVERQLARAGVDGAEVVALVVAQRDVAKLDVAVARQAAAGASGGATMRGSRSSTWKMRAPEAVARWASPSVTPSERIGPISMFR